MASVQSLVVAKEAEWSDASRSLLVAEKAPLASEKSFVAANNNIACNRNCSGCCVSGSCRCKMLKDNTRTATWAILAERSVGKMRLTTSIRILATLIAKEWGGSNGNSDSDVANRLPS